MKCSVVLSNPGYLPYTVYTELMCTVSSDDDLNYITISHGNGSKNNVGFISGLHKIKECETIFKHCGCS
jgi:hypothetical protein